MTPGSSNTLSKNLKQSLHNKCLSIQLFELKVAILNLKIHISSLSSVALLQKALKMMGFSFFFPHKKKKPTFFFVCVERPGYPSALQK